MEQRRFCADCHAPAVKGASFCVVCGGSNFILPQVEETPVKAVAIDDGVVGVAADSKFIKTALDTDLTVDIAEEQTVGGFPQPSRDYQPTYVSAPVKEEAPQVPQANVYNSHNPQDIYSNYTPQPVEPIYEPQPIQPVVENPQPIQNVAPVMPDEGRTVAYKSFEEYERELAEQEALNGKQKKPKNGGGAKSVFKKIGFAILCIFLSAALLAGGFAIGVYFTHSGALDEYLPERAEEIDEDLQEQVDDCYEAQQDLAKTVKSYITENNVYVDKTTIITIESTNDGDRCLVSVEGDCMTSAECAELLGNDFICPSEGTYVVSIIPYVDSDGKSMFKIEVSCDGGEEGYKHY